MKYTVKIEGMMCEHCVKAVKTALEELGYAADVSLDAGTAVIDADTIDEAAVKAAIDDTGYDVVSIE